MLAEVERGAAAELHDRRLGHAVRDKARLRDKAAGGRDVDDRARGQLARVARVALHRARRVLDAERVALHVGRERGIQLCAPVRR